jgi:hypothetical protein
MNTGVLRTAVMITVICALPVMAEAQTGGSVGAPEPTKFGVGFQGTWPAYGLSGMMDVTEDISAQAIIGFFGSLNTFAARGLYKFQKEDYWNLYGFGMVGVWSYSVGSLSETVPGFGLGGGISYDWRAFDENLPPIFWNLELGLGFVNFDEVDYSFSTVLFGAGLHYRF